MQIMERVHDTVSSPLFYFVVVPFTRKHGKPKTRVWLVREYSFFLSGTFDNSMLIGELSKASGFSKDTIRFYEKIGLVELPKHARRDNNYKDYPQEVLKTLLSIKNLKGLGFTLEEIREIIVRQQVDALDRETTFKIIDQKIIHLDVQIDKLILYKHRLQLARRQVLGEKINHTVPLTEMKMCA